MNDHERMICAAILASGTIEAGNITSSDVAAIKFWEIYNALVDPNNIRAACQQEE